MKVYKLAIVIIDIIDYEELSSDYYDSHVIAAQSATVARLIANQKTGGEGKVWEDTDKVNCYVVGEYTGERNEYPHIILSSYNAG